MFFEGDRIAAVREMILADDPMGRAAALAKLLPMQRDRFRRALPIMEGLPVTIRLLDPPLHEFLPKTEEEIAEVAEAIGLPVKSCASASKLHEFNPMLGHRGCRLGISYPEITEMQARAIFEAPSRRERRPARRSCRGDDPAGRHFAKELDFVKAGRCRRQAKSSRGRRRIPYMVGTMIELPRAALRADDIAQHGRVLLLRHQRPDPDHLRHFAR
jgi:pyruvate,orthophosphate dikinase